LNIFAFNPTDKDLTIKLDDYYIIVCALVGYIQDSSLYSGNYETLVAHQVEVLELKK